MSFKTRSARRIVKNTKRKFLFTIFLILFLIYATVQWILPNIVGGVGIITSTFKEPKKQEKLVAENAALAPPSLTIPYEATNSSKIAIKGYSTSNSKVKIYIDDALVDTIDADTDGTFTTKELRLNSGLNNIYGRSVDTLGKESLASKTYKLLFDNEKPDLKVTDPAPDAKTTQGDQGRLFVRGLAEQNAQVFVNNIQQIIDSKGEFHTFVPLKEGENTVTVKAVDKSSNSTEITRTITYEPPAPSPSPSTSPSPQP